MRAQLTQKLRSLRNGNLSPSPTVGTILLEIKAKPKARETHLCFVSPLSSAAGRRGPRGGRVVVLIVVVVVLAVVIVVVVLAWPSWWGRCSRPSSGCTWRMIFHWGLRPAGFNVHEKQRWLGNLRERSCRSLWCILAASIVESFEGAFSPSSLHSRLSITPVDFASACALSRAFVNRFL